MRLKGEEEEAKTSKKLPRKGEVVRLLKESPNRDTDPGRPVLLYKNRRLEKSPW